MRPKYRNFTVGAISVSALALCHPAFATGTGVGTGTEQAATPAAALNDEDKPIDVPVTGNEIVVVSKRIPGQVVAPQAPIQTFDEQDIAAYGASSIDELIDSIAPQTGSGRGRGDGTPVILLNGQRISSFRELRRIPPEAIRRMEVLPEEVALRFGYPPDQRVVNIILKDHYAATTVSGEINVPTRGGYENHAFEGGIVKIEGLRRYNVSAEINNTSMLTDAERGITEDASIMPTVSGDPDPAKYRSLIAQDHVFTLEGTITQGLGEKGYGGSLTGNVTYSHESKISLSGLDTVTLEDPDGDTAIRTLPDPLETRVITDEIQVGLGFNKSLGPWQLSVTSDNGYTTADTWTDNKRDTSSLVDAAAAGTLSIDGALPDVPGSGVNHALNRTFTSTNVATINGSPFEMPAGEASLTAKAGYAFNNSQSEASNSLVGNTTLNRGDVSGSVNLALPLTSRSADVLGAIGDISLNLSGGIDQLSDFGTLTNWNAGVTWSPTDTLTLGASYIVADAAPTLTQLGAPETITYNVATYDYTNSRTALVTVISGGNPDLRKERQRDWKFSANWKLPFLDRSNLLVEYFRNRSTNVSETFPTLTTAVEGAFPDRVTRDAEGNLLTIDERPVTFDEVKSSNLRWGFNLSGNVGKKQEDQKGGSNGGRRGPGGGGFGPPPKGSGRWNLSIYHTWRFNDTIKIADGVPVLDQLNGGAITSGGVARHEITGEGGVFMNGVGFRLKGTWTAPTTVDGSGAPDSTDLRFGSTFITQLRLFMDLGQQEKLVKKLPFFKDARLSFVVENLFDSRQKVTNSAGETPLAYQRAYMEPQGRVVGLELRKMF
ncbi:TonB-dependent receptor plug domain-containing protein [Novosphingobium sp. 9]|uniref:TonB-dependent receptor plug domain-containing protein n=1 Tax=Novosphingobium sp. 9 TaxID=2025349 RepID=UPI0021B5DE6E|nr:TonB-dependent receptor [Novosphingobium sp. 9]